MISKLAGSITPDWEGFIRCIRREGTPRRVHHIELYLDAEVQEAVCSRFDLLAGIDRADPFFDLRRQIAIQRFLGYDYVRKGVDGLDFPLQWDRVKDTAGLGRSNGRAFINEHEGPINSWEDFERYPWPDPHAASTRALEWYERNLPDDMCVIGSGGFAHFAEYLSWLMGYENFCIALLLQRDLVEAIAARLIEIYEVVVARMLQFERVKVLWGSDDMGFRTQTLVSPKDLRALVLPGHKCMASAAHAAARPYLLHSCGMLADIMDDLIDDVGIDGKHSFEDTIERVEDAKQTYGRRVALLGGIDVDFLCRSDEAAIRDRVRRTLDLCLPGGGYLLGTGNSVANYIPLENYLIMLDEGRRYAGSALN